MMIFRAAVLAAPLALFGFSAASQHVTLTSHDGSVEVSGNLAGYDGEFYRIETEFGTLTVDGAGVDCRGADCPDVDHYVADITLSGAPVMGSVLMPSLIEAFAARNGYAVRRVTQPDDRIRFELVGRDDGAPVARFVVRLNSSQEGLADLIADKADIALSLREVTPEEAAGESVDGMGDLRAPGRSRIVALDALVPLVSVQNPLTKIDMADLAAVFSGEIDTWAPLGGEPEAITLHLPEDGSALSQVFEHRVMAEYGKPGEARSVVRHASAAALAEAVAADPFALGMGSFSGIGDAVPLSVAGSCNFASAATVTDIKTEDYPLTTPLFAYLPPRRLPQIARNFLRYIASPAAQPVIRRAGFVDQFPAGIPFKHQGTRFANAIDRAGPEIDLAELQRLVRTLSGHNRLTVTFRFEGGSSALDAQSRSNVALLAEAIQRGVFDGRRLMFVGFSDGQGPEAINRRISLNRADAVRIAVRAAARSVDLSRLELHAEAFGEAMPMACDEVGWGRRVNRRVEVWLK